MKTKARIAHQDLLFAPIDGVFYTVILQDGMKVKAQWNAATSCFHIDGDQTVTVLRREVFDWWPTNI